MLVMPQFLGNSFTEMKELGSGGFGVVFKARHKVNNNLYAIKKQSIDRKLFNKGKYLMEIMFLAKLKSEYVVKYESSWFEPNKEKINESLLYIQMEYCSQTLEQLIEDLMKELNCKQSLCETPISFYILSELMKEIIEGVDYLHKNNIIHRDLKPSNILITDFKNGRIVRIADFGISCVHESRYVNKYHSRDVGDLEYMAPELQKSSVRPDSRVIYDQKVDIYSMGKFFNEFINGKKQNTNHTVCQITTLYPLLNNMIKSKLENLIKLIKRMTNENIPEDRPDCEEMLKNINKYLINLNEFEASRDELKIDRTSEGKVYVQYIVNKFYHHLVWDKNILKNINFSFNHFLGLPNFKSYHNGKEHCIARTVDGKLYSFGSNKCKQLGYKTGDEHYRPKVIESLKNENVIQVSCGDYHTLVLTQKGEVYGWGDNMWGQIGNESGKSIPMKINEFNAEPARLLKVKRLCYHSKKFKENTVFDCPHSGCDLTQISFDTQIKTTKSTEKLFKKIVCKGSKSILLSTNDVIYLFGYKIYNQYKCDESPEDQLLIRRMIDKKHPLITFSDSNSDMIPSQPLLVLCKYWLDYQSIPKELRPAVDKEYNKLIFRSLQELRNV